MSNDFASKWYVVSQTGGECLIVTAMELVNYSVEEEEEGDVPTVECWGPFDSENDAIAKRVGLIRAGKCQPKR